MHYILAEVAFILLLKNSETNNKYPILPMFFKFDFPSCWNKTLVSKKNILGKGNLS